MNNHIITIAGNKAFGGTAYDKSRKVIEAGEYEVDTTVRLIGSIKKGLPFESKVAAAANPWRLLRVALSKLNGVTINSLVEESIQDSGEDAAIKEAADEAIKRLIAPTARTMPGKTTGKVVFDVLEVAR